MTVSDDESFELPVIYKGQETIMYGKFERWGYSYRIHIMIDESEIVFEPDEERNFRAIIEDIDIRLTVKVDFVKAIGEALHKYLR